MTTDKDYLLQVKIKNNLLAKKMRQRGIESVSELSRLTGVDQSELGRILNLKTNVFSRKTGDIKPSFLKLCDFFNCGLNDIYPVAHHYDPLEKNTSEVEMSIEDVSGLLGYEEQPLELIGYIKDALNTLTPRQADILNSYYGFDGEGTQTFAEIAEEKNLSIERIRQIHDKSLRKLSHKSKLGNLREYVH